MLLEELFLNTFAIERDQSMSELGCVIWKILVFFEGPESIVTLFDLSITATCDSVERTMLLPDLGSDERAVHNHLGNND